MIATTIALLSLTLSTQGTDPNPAMPPAAIPDARATAQGWVPLFDGKSLNDWTPKIAGHTLGEDPYKTVQVQDGLIRVSYEGYEGDFNGRFLHLFYKAPFDEYDLLVEYRFKGDQAKGGPGWAHRNSGAMLHCQNPTTMAVDQSFPVSIEGQFLGGNGTHDRTTMNLCTPGTHVMTNDTLDRRHCINSSSQTYHGDQWVTARFKVRNNHIEHYVDDELVLMYDSPQLDPSDPDAEQLIKDDVVAWNRGWIALQGESHPIDFKRVWIRPILATATPTDKTKPIKAAPTQP